MTDRRFTFYDAENEQQALLGWDAATIFNMMVVNQQSPDLLLRAIFDLVNVNQGDKAKQLMELLLDNPSSDEESVAQLIQATVRAAQLLDAAEIAFRAFEDWMKLEFSQFSEASKRPGTDMRSMLLNLFGSDGNEAYDLIFGQNVEE